MLHTQHVLTEKKEGHDYLMAGLSRVFKERGLSLLSNMWLQTPPLAQRRSKSFSLEKKQDNEVWVNMTDLVCYIEKIF